MPENLSALTEGAVKSLFLYAGVPLDDERIATHLAQYSTLLNLSRGDVFSGLSETPPATAFKADWE